jgi:hypothetical protein
VGQQSFTSAITCATTLSLKKSLKITKKHQKIPIKTTKNTEENSANFILRLKIDKNNFVKKSISHFPGKNELNFS